MQPARDLHRLPLLLAQGEIAVGTGLSLAGRLRQHLGQLGTRAVAAGIARLGVDRAGNQADEGVEQLLARSQQAPGLDRDRGSTESVSANAS